MPIAGSRNSFARLEAMVSRHSVAHLSNASATWWPGAIGDASPVLGVRVIFDREFSEFGGQTVNDANPVGSVHEPDVPGIRRDHVMQIQRDGEAIARTYRITKASPNGQGLVQLHFQELDS